MVNLEKKRILYKNKMFTILGISGLYNLYVLKVYDVSKDIEDKLKDILNGCFEYSEKQELKQQLEELKKDIENLHIYN